jgi:hypothetical protein
MEFRVYWHDGQVERLSAEGVMPAIDRAIALHPLVPGAERNTHYIDRIESLLIDGSGREKWEHS